MVDQSIRTGRIESVRRFSRFYTRRIGVLREGLLESPFSLAEARVIYELAHKERATASELSEELGLDAGYLSRILRSFQRQGLVQKRRDASDGRQYHLWLSEGGEEAFARLNAASSQEIDAMLRPLSDRDQAELVEAMSTIEKLLGSSRAHRAPYVLRPHQAGDMGWVVHRHGTMYAQEYGWDETFEALVAGIVAKFIQRFDPRRERCWIAERDGENVGCVFLVKHTKTVAKLRLLLVDPRARGLGIGRRLVEECVRFARERGYSKLALWTNDVLDAARHIYETVGFELVQEERHHSFGHDLVGQTWEKKL